MPSVTLRRNANGLQIHASNNGNNANSIHLGRCGQAPDRDELRDTGVYVLCCSARTAHMCSCAERGRGRESLCATVVFPLELPLLFLCCVSLSFPLCVSVALPKALRFSTAVPQSGSFRRRSACSLCLSLLRCLSLALSAHTVAASVSLSLVCVCVCGLCLQRKCHRGSDTTFHVCLSSPHFEHCSLLFSSLFSLLSLSLSLLLSSLPL